ncbi:hypothetical protein EA772_09410 [Pedobacter sp. G11]|uniref:hypothetical protein n=1 Tax=Pedobacter sp. G11 TaxID=2482728 RepID=UPI000F5FBF05|nr:hypothetical protein [Pedobacter sp. G11]AZI25548.1 hypothetical protein EA772_09410 [Pedobacter sp. G11]
MRLFYTIIFICSSYCFASALPHAKHHDNQFKKAKLSFLSDKKLFKLNADSAMENETLEKDLINNITPKIALAFLLLMGIVVNFFKSHLLTCKIILRKLKYSYWCLLKMLYPKHVFW